MALNVAVPLSGIGELFEGCGLLSPIIPFGFKNKFDMLMPSVSSDITSSSSSASSTTSVSSATSSNHSDSSAESGDDSSDETKVSKARKISTCLKMLKLMKYLQNESTTVKAATEEKPPQNDDQEKLKRADEDETNTSVCVADAFEVKRIEPKVINQIMYQQRNILDLGSHLNDRTWMFAYAHLPSNNLQMFLNNRSQYHRLSENSTPPEYDIDACNFCEFQSPIKHDTEFAASSPKQLQQPPQQQQLQQQQNHQHHQYQLPTTTTAAGNEVINYSKIHSQMNSIKKMQNYETNANKKMYYQRHAYNDYYNNNSNNNNHHHYNQHQNMQMYRHF